MLGIELYISPLFFNWQSQNDTFIPVLPPLTPSNLGFFSELLKLEFDVLACRSGTNNILTPIGGDFNFQDAPTLVRSMCGLAAGVGRYYLD